MDDLVELVHSARSAGASLTVVGSGHSPSDIAMAPTTGWLVNLDRLCAVVSTFPATAQKTTEYSDVRVEAGIRVYQLNAALAFRGLALQNLGSISEQSIAGLISTGTHGSSSFHGPLAQQVVDLTLLTAAGDFRTVSPTTDPDLFKAALLSLGKLGIITHVTLRTIPAFNIHSVQEIIDFDRLLADWRTVWTTKEYVRVWWFPYSRKCVLWRAEKSTLPLSNPRSSFYGTWLGRTLYEAMLWFAVNIFPPSMPAVERFVFSRQYGSTQTYDTPGASVDEAVQGSVEGLNMDCLFKQYVNEWAVPMRDGVEILTQVDKLVSEAASKHDYYVHAPIEVRVSNCSVPPENDIPDSPFAIIRANSGIGAIPGNYCRSLLEYAPRVDYPSPGEPITVDNLTLYINATMYRPFGRDPPIGKWYSEFEAVMAQYGGRPHWAKNFIGPAGALNAKDEAKRKKKDGQMVGIAGVFAEWYGEDGQKFKKIREKLDPDMLFVGGREWAERNGLI